MKNFTEFIGASKSTGSLMLHFFQHYSKTKNKIELSKLIKLERKILNK